MRINLRFGISVYTQDGHAGNLEQLVVTPDDRPLALVLYPGRILSKQHLVTIPVSLVTGISVSRIQIAANRNELAVLAEKHAPTSQEIAGWELKGGASIIDAAYQTVGKVQGAVLESDQCIMSHLMARYEPYHIAPQNRLIPTYLLAQTTLNTIHLYIAADYEVGLALTEPW
jgi:hypothetical protein